MNQPRMPSPAILVAGLAIVAALAGTAVAGPDATSSAVTKKKVKKIAKKQAIKQINELAPGLSVEHANSAETANRAETANPIAFARVSLSGVVRAANSENITQANVTHPSDVYCFRGLDFAVKGVQVTIDFKGPSDDNFAQAALGQAGACPSNTQASVSPQDLTGNPSESGFFITFYN